jgi:hypothetical protein
MFEYFTVEFMEFLSVITWIWQPNDPSLASDNTLVYLFPHILYYGLSTLAEKNHQALLVSISNMQCVSNIRKSTRVLVCAVGSSESQSGRCSLSDMVLGVLNMRTTIIVVQTTAQFCFWSCFLFCLGLGQLKLGIEKSSVPGPNDHMLWCH